MPLAQGVGCAGPQWGAHWGIKAKFDSGCGATLGPFILDVRSVWKFYTFVGLFLYGLLTDYIEWCHTKVLSLACSQCPWSLNRPLPLSTFPL